MLELAGPGTRLSPGVRGEAWWPSTWTTRAGPAGSSTSWVGPADLTSGLEDRRREMLELAGTMEEFILLVEDGLGLQEVFTEEVNQMEDSKNRVLQCLTSTSMVTDPISMTSGASTGNQSFAKTNS